MSSVPEEMYLEILSRVPSRSTFACKCVCKSWFQIISDPIFIKMHLNITLQKDRHCLMLNSDKIYTLSHDTEFDNQDDVITLEYPYQFDSDYSGVSLLGSCNGLVALSYHCYGKYKEDEEILRIWNPLTREIITLPEPPNFVIIPFVGIHAVGYDDKIDDYKLVKVRDNGSTVDVYTLGTNSWKTIQPVSYHFYFVRVPGVLVHGDLHWLGNTSVSEVIVSFNISDERFREIQPPNQSQDGQESNYYLRSVGLLEGSLCMLSNVVDVGIDIWVMKEYGVQESWTKRYFISNENFPYASMDILDDVNEYDYFIRLVSSSKNGKIVFAVPDSLVIYDPDHGSVEKSSIVIPLRWYENDNYCKSLVPLGSGRYYPEKLEDEEEVEEEEDEEVEDEEEEEEEDEA